MKVSILRHSTGAETMKVDLGNDSYIMIDRYVFPDGHEEYRVRLLRYGMKENRDGDAIEIDHEYEYAGEEGPEWCSETQYVKIKSDIEGCEKSEDLNKHSATVNLSGLAEVEYKLETHPVSGGYYNTFVMMSIDTGSNVGRELWDTFKKYSEE